MYNCRLLQLWTIWWCALFIACNGLSTQDVSEPFIGWQGETFNPLQHAGKVAPACCCSCSTSINFPVIQANIVHACSSCGRGAAAGDRRGEGLLLFQYPATTTQSPAAQQQVQLCSSHQACHSCVSGTLYHPL
jgi:hypothetical protein